MLIIVLLAIFCCSSAYGEEHPGLKNIATKAYSPTVMDPNIFANLWRSWDPESRERAEKASDEDRRKMTLDRYGLLEAPFDNGGAPLGMVVNEEGSYAISCLVCHAGAVAGETIIGVSNTAVDFSAIYEDTGSTVKILHGQKPGNPPFPEGLVTMAGKGPDPADVHFPKGSLSVFKGTTNSFTFSVHFMSHRDRDLNFIPEPLPIGPSNHYLDPPPLWHSTKKTSYYYDAFTEKSVRSLMQFSLDPSTDGEVFKSWEGDYKEIYDWVHTIESPKYRGEVDSELASHGKKVYARSCVKCHGVPGVGGKYENKVVPIEKVKTDRSRLDSLSVAFKEHFSNSWMGSYGEDDVRTSSRGYVAPPLDGIWASAPYFHNGSVPTVYHVLFPAERPAVWRVKDYESYDHDRVGLLVDEHPLMPETSNLSERRAYYDTNQKTMDNGGHPFANKLTKEQRLSLLEYLKSL